MLDAIRRLPNGARFFRADLHAHTPADPGFHCLDFNLTTEEEKRALARRYVAFAGEEQGLDIIGITDHNDVSWVTAIQEAAREQGEGLIVLPGVELGANEGKRQVHYVALFDPGTTAEEIDHFISSLGLLPQGRFDPVSRTPRLVQMSCRELTARIGSQADGLPGLPIAAHATRKNGLLHELEGEGRVLAYEDPHLLAIEIPDTRDSLSPFVRRLIGGQEVHYGRKVVACLNSSDGRGLGQTNEANRLSIGDRATRIKLSHISIGALRQAFIDFDSRIRLAGEFVEEKYPRLLGLAVENGFLAGAGGSEHPIGEAETKPSPFLLHFNPNLNTVIGGRGTGKSSLLEALRFVFDLPPRTEATSAQRSGIIDVTLPAGSVVTAYYETADGTCYQVRRRRGSAPVVTDVASGTPAGVHPAALLPSGQPLEVYGQKEVYEIASDPAFQLNLIDTFIGERLRDVRRRESDLLRWLAVNGQAILHLQDELAESEQEVQALAAVRLELARLEKVAGHEGLVARKTIEAEQRVLDAAERQAAAVLAQVDGWLAEPRPVPPGGDPEHLVDQTILVERMAVAVEASLEELRAELAAIWESGAAARVAWRDRAAVIEQAAEAHLNGREEAAAVERYFELKKREGDLARMAAGRTQKAAELDSLHDERREKLAELRLLRREEETRLRLEKAAELNQALGGAVCVDLTPQGHTGRFADFLTDLFKAARSGVTRKVVELLAEAGQDPIDLTSAIRAERADKVNGEGETPLSDVYGISASYRDRLAALDDATLFELETYRVPDLPDISLRVGEIYRSLSPPAGVPGLSTGQKCTAILSIILVERNTPLVIDQPEDDLDNAFIFSEIVQTLRREKERRQFIIATHNANIPVSGDAELILLMEADERHGWVAHSGSIDDPQIREPVENILEGGREAFRLRQAKYGIS